jgi:hypothetical protein
MMSQRASLEGREINITDLVNHISDSAVGLTEVSTICWNNMMKTQVLTLLEKIFFCFLP